MKFSWIKAAIIGGATLIGMGAYMITKKNDSIIEQVAESVLRTQGVDIDFSPDDDE